MRIWKWTLDLVDVQTIEVPAGAKLLSVQVQQDKIQLWALCDENAPKEPRRIALYGTGNPMPDNPSEYIATFQMYNGHLVLHAFEIVAR
jgi:hypothetical protein